MDDLFFAFVAVGFVAQLIDGALGMAYGVASTTALVFLGVPPAIASANVHVAEVFTTAASGTSHAIARNIDWRLFRRLALAGSTGAVLGAFFISFIQPDLQILLQLRVGSPGGRRDGGLKIRKRRMLLLLGDDEVCRTGSWGSVWTLMTKTIELAVELERFMKL